MKPQYNPAMGYKPSILNIYALLFLLGCVGFTIYNYDQLSEGEGWGVVGMVGLFAFGLALLLVDVVIRNLVKNRIVANLAGLVVSIVATLIMLNGGMFN